MTAADEPTRSMTAVARPAPRPARRPAGTGQPSRASTAALIVLALLLLAAVFAVGQLTT